jgi:hypothetical protein
MKELEKFEPRPGMTVEQLARVVALLVDRLREGLGRLTNAENMLAAPVTLTSEEHGLTSAAEVLVQYPAKFKPTGARVIAALDANGAGLDIGAFKFNPKPTNAPGYVGITIAVVSGTLAEARIVLEGG